jgi:hypothetical protein
MPVVWVTKADGTRQPFEPEKVVSTCLRMGVDKEAAEAIVKRVESQAYDGIPTKKILQLVFRYLKKYRPALKHRIDLRKAISLLRPKPDFELFVQLLLREYGYRVLPNQIVRGKCIEHEIDAIARREDETILVEVKHHFNHHTYTGLDVPRIARAIIEDLTEGFDIKLTPMKFNKVLIVCNTKFSEHAIQYAKCRDLNLIGWRTPPDRGLEQMIEEKRFYPITFLKGLNRKSEEKLADNGVILLKQLTTCDLGELSRKTGIQREVLKGLKKNAEEILC